MSRRDEDDGHAWAPTPEAQRRRAVDLLDPDWGQSRRFPPRYPACKMRTVGYIALYEAHNISLGLSKPGFINLNGEEL